MINPKELMLGNWIIYDDDETKCIMYITGFYDDVIQINFEGNDGCPIEVGCEEVFPIPLTEDIFNKNSFEYLDGVYYFKQCSNTEFCKNDDGYFYMTSNLGEYNCIERPIKYVHQLQNILTIAGIDIDFKI